MARFPWAAALAGVLIVAELARDRRRVAVKRASAPPRRPGAAAAAAAVALVVLLAPAAARSQSDWARGDAAFRAGAWARAESLYSLRARHGTPAPLQVNLTTAKARQGKDATEWEEALGRLGEASGRAGQAAHYNLGTLLGEKQEYDRALESLRRALERDPNDADARWNYELVMRDRQRREDSRQPKPKQDPRKSPSQPDPGGQAPQGQQGGSPPPKPGGQEGQQQVGPTPPQSPPGTPTGMSRAAGRAAAGLAPGAGTSRAPARAPDPRDERAKGEGLVRGPCILFALMSLVAFALAPRARRRRRLRPRCRPGPSRSARGSRWSWW